MRTMGGGYTNTTPSLRTSRVLRKLRLATSFPSPQHPSKRSPPEPVWPRYGWSIMSETRHRKGATTLSKLNHKYDASIQKALNNNFRRGYSQRARANRCARLCLSTVAVNIWVQRLQMNGASLHGFAQLFDRADYTGREFRRWWRSVAICYLGDARRPFGPVCAN